MINTWVLHEWIRWRLRIFGSSRLRCITDTRLLQSAEHRSVHSVVPQENRQQPPVFHHLLSEWVISCERSKAGPGLSGHRQVCSHNNSAKKGTRGSVLLLPGIFDQYTGFPEVDAVDIMGIVTFQIVTLYEVTGMTQQGIAHSSQLDFFRTIYLTHLVTSRARCQLPASHHLLSALVIT